MWCGVYVCGMRNRTFCLPCRPVVCVVVCVDARVLAVVAIVAVVQLRV